MGDQLCFLNNTLLLILPVRQTHTALNILVRRRANGLSGGVDFTVSNVGNHVGRFCFRSAALTLLQKDSLEQEFFPGGGQEAQALFHGAAKHGIVVGWRPEVRLPEEEGGAEGVLVGAGEHLVADLHQGLGGFWPHHTRTSVKYFEARPLVASGFGKFGRMYSTFKTSVSDPDPDWIRIQSDRLIHIRIHRFFKILVIRTLDPRIGSGRLGLKILNPNLDDGSE
jgi:hypothetical protein